MVVRRLVIEVMNHIRKSRYFYDNNKLFLNYVPSGRDVLKSGVNGVFVFVDYEDEIYDFFITLNIFRKLNFKIYKFSHYIDANFYAAPFTVPEIELFVYIDPYEEPFNYNDIVASLYEVLTHEMEHLYQEDFNRKPDRPDINLDLVKELRDNSLRHYYNLIKHERFPTLKGLKRKAKFNKSSFNKELDDHLRVQNELGNICQDKILFVEEKLKEYYYEQFR